MKLVVPNRVLLFVPWKSVRVAELYAAHTTRQLRSFLRKLNRISKLKAELEQDSVKFVKEHTFEDFMLVTEMSFLFRATVLVNNLRKINAPTKNRVIDRHNATITELRMKLESMK